MNLYKIIAKIGHRGTGNYGEMPFYICANTITESMQIIKKLPTVKKLSSFPATSIRIVEEKEFIVGNIKNQYFNYVRFSDKKEINPLSNVINQLSKLKDYDFTTEEGRLISDFCNKYEQANNKEKELIEKEYVAWAKGLLEQSLSEEFIF